jgi:hypothetical protein
MHPNMYAYFQICLACAICQSLSQLQSPAWKAPLSFVGRSTTSNEQDIGPTPKDDDAHADAGLGRVLS